MAQSDRDGTTHWQGCEAVHDHGAPASPAQPQHKVVAEAVVAGWLIASPTELRPDQRTALEQRVTTALTNAYEVARHSVSRAEEAEAALAAERERIAGWLEAIYHHPEWQWDKLLEFTASLRAPASAPAATVAVSRLRDALDGAQSALVGIQTRANGGGSSYEEMLGDIADQATAALNEIERHYAALLPASPATTGGDGDANG